MKILHINSFDTGGAAIAAKRLHMALLEEGHDSKILFSKLTNENTPNSFGYKVLPKGIFHRLIFRLKTKLGLKKEYWANLHSKLLGRVKGFEAFTTSESDFDITSQKVYQDADVVNLHWISGFVDDSFFKKNNKPVIWTLHDMNPFTGGCHNSMGCLKFQNDCNSCFQLEGTTNKNLALINLNRKTRALSDKSISIMCLSDWMLNHSSTSKLFSKYQHFRVNHSIDLKQFKAHNQQMARELLDLPQGKTIILAISERHNKGKGYDILERVLAINTNQDIYFCSIGKNPENPLIHNLGYITDLRLLSLIYSASSAVLIPSREENAPNLIPEAFACGRPIIGFKIGGLPDHVLNGKTGFLASSISATALYDQIDYLHNLKDALSAKQIRQYAEENFSSVVQINSYKKILKQF